MKAICLLLLMSAGAAFGQANPINNYPATGGQFIVAGFCTGVASSNTSGLALFNLGSTTTACTAGRTGLGFLMTRAGTLRNFAVRCHTTGVNVSSGVFTVFDAPAGTSATTGASTGITVTYGNRAIDTLAMDTVDTFAASAGDIIQVAFATQLSETIGTCSASFQIQ